MSSTGQTEQDKPAKQINLVFTLNKDEIPTPFSGTFYHPGAGLKLTKELVGDADKVELKVIAVQEGSLPSEVAYKCFRIKEGTRLHIVAQTHDAMLDKKRSDLPNDSIKHLFDKIQNSGPNSVASSPDMNDDCLLNF